MSHHDSHAIAHVYYDAECRLCVTLARTFGRALHTRDMQLVPLQAPGVAAVLGVAEHDLMTEMRVRLRNGLVIGGADGMLEVARRMWWAWPLWALSRIPGAMRPMRAFYRWVARNRGCTGRVCAIPQSGNS